MKKYEGFINAGEADSPSPAAGIKRAAAFYATL
jgi:hypothetical protein